MKYAYYPGCSSETSARISEISLHRLLGLLGVTFVEIEDWNCCGASSAHAIEPVVATGLAARNLGLAAKEALDVVTGCASCFFRLRTADETMRQDPAIRDSVNRTLAAPYGGGVRIRSILDVLLEAFEKAPEPPPVKRRMPDLRIVCYYGCLFGRAPGDQSYDDPENPTAMERLLARAGLTALDWNGKVDCCGAGAVVIAPPTAAGLQARLLADARERGANAIATACPMCQLNLDMGQYRKVRDPEGPAPLPVYFITQLLGLAYGFSPEELGIDGLLIAPPPIAPHDAGAEVNVDG